LLFVDMGVEHPGYISHMLDVSRALDCPLVLLKPKDNFWLTLLEKGWPRWNFPWCHDMLHDALKTYVREHYDPSDTLRITGSRSKQAKRTSEKRADTPLNSTPEYRHYAPIFDWTEDACATKLRELGLPIWEGYALGFCRTACWCCPGQRGQTYAALRDHYPGLFREMKKLIERLGPGFWNSSQETMQIFGLAPGEQTTEQNTDDS